MKIEMIKSEYTHNLKRTGCVLIRLINETLKWFPFNLVMVPAILFYFVPDSVLSEVIYEWQQSDMSGKIFSGPAISESCICVCFCRCVF